MLDMLPWTHHLNTVAASHAVKQQPSGSQSYSCSLIRSGEYSLHVWGLCRDLEQLEAIPSRQWCMQRTELCCSLAGNSCPLITITNPSPEPHTQRPAVVFTGTACSLASCRHAQGMLSCTAHASAMSRPHVIQSNVVHHRMHCTFMPSSACASSACQAEPHMPKLSSCHP